MFPGRLPIPFFLSFLRRQRLFAGKGGDVLRDGHEDGGADSSLCVRHWVSLCLILGALLNAPTWADDGDTRLEVKQTEIIWEFSPYYTSVGALVPIGNALQTVGTDQMSEADVYHQLFINSGSPNLFLLEASVYPMPWLGTELKKNSPGLYGRDTSQLSLIPALTAGFQEPWAISAFLGNDMLFVRPGQAIKETNRGFMGYLITYGNKHIANNLLIDDEWLELEWKMKGERIFKEDRLSWSFRIGTRLHKHEDIADTLYLGISRSSLDFDAPMLSWLQNTKVNVLTEVVKSTGKFSRQEVIFGKKLPVKSAWMAAWQIEIGAVYDSASKYSGVLTQKTEKGTTFILRPNIEF